MLTIDIDIVNH